MSDSNYSKLLERVVEWEAQGDGIGVPVSFYRRLLTIQARLASALTPQPPAVSQDVIASRLLVGEAALRFDELVLDWASIAEAVGEVAEAAAELLPDRAKECGTLKALACDPAQLRGAAKLWFNVACPPPGAGDDSVPGGEALALGLAVALGPFLSAQSRLLLPLVDQEKWRRGYCPICGGAPDFAYLAKEAGDRWLLCSRCDAEWLFQRLECPFCANQDQGTLAYYAADGYQYRLYVCNKCRGYLKAIDLRYTEREVWPPFERLSTLPLDRQARQAGYSPGVRQAAS